MKKFTVKRSNWLRGTGEGCLLNDKGKMCCLGFAVNQICKVSKKRLLGYYLPNNVLPNKDTVFTSHGTDYLSGKSPENKLFVNYAMEINDDKDISDKNREELLTEIFKEEGIEVTFID